MLIRVYIAEWVVTKWAPRCESKSDDCGESDPVTMFSETSVKIKTRVKECKKKEKKKVSSSEVALTTDMLL